MLFGAIGKVVQYCHRRHFLIENVVQAFRVDSGGVFTVFGDVKALDPIRVRGQPRNFAVLCVDFVKTHGWLVVRVVDDFGIIFLLFQLLFVQSRIFLPAVDQRVFVQPVDLLRRVRQLGESPGLASVSVHQPDLHRRHIWLGFGPRTCTEKCDLLAVRRPARLRVGIAAARERNLVALRQAGKNQVAHAQIFFFVSSGFRPDHPFGIRRNAELPRRFSVNEIFRLPRLFLYGCLLVVHASRVRGHEKTAAGDETSQKAC